MKKIQPFFHNILALFLLATLGVVLVLFLNNRVAWPTQEPQTASTQLAFQSPIKKATLVAPTATLTPTRTPVIIPVIITRFPTPTPAPSPTPTPTFEPLSDKPIMGFVFKPPQEIPNTRNSIGYYKIVGWLPGSSKEVLVEGPLTLETVNVLNGTTKLYAEVKSPGNIYQPTWLPDIEGVAYLSADDKAHKTDLWLGQAGGKTQILLSGVGIPFIPIEKGRGVAVYDKSSKAMKAFLPDNKQNLKSVSQPTVILSPQIKTDNLVDTTYQPKGDWVAYYNIDGFQLMNSKSGEVRSVDLGEYENEPLWAFEAKWSPDGQRLALIVARGRANFDFTDLYILEWPAGKLYKIEDTFTYLTDIAWGPDSKHLLLKAVIGQKNGLSVDALYITDVLKSSKIVPVPIPIEGLTGFGNSLSWSPDGKTILVQYFNGQEAAFYRIDVTTQ